MVTTSPVYATDAAHCIVRHVFAAEPSGEPNPFVATKNSAARTGRAANITAATGITST